MGVTLAKYASCNTSRLHFEPFQDLSFSTLFSKLTYVTCFLHLSSKVFQYNLDQILSIQAKLFHPVSLISHVNGIASATKV